MKKRFISLILAMVMALSLLTGCQKNTQAESSASSATDASVSSSVTAETDEMQEYEVIGVQSAIASDGTVMDVQLNVLDADGEDILINMGRQQLELANALYQYQSGLTFRAEVDDDGKLVRYSVVKNETGEDLGALTAEELFAQFDWESLYGCVDYICDGTVVLSQLEQDNTAYKITLGEEGATLDFVNDTGKNVLIYAQDSLGNEITEQFCPAESIGEPMFSGVDVFGDFVLLRRVTLEQDEVEKVLGEEFVFRLSTATLGESGDIGIAECIYNDTDEDIKVYNFTEEEFLIPAGSMVGCNWMDFDVFHAEKP